jgi:hypothetical protein
MSYIINRWNGDQQSIVQDGTVDQSLDIQLVGKNYAGYGEIQNETFLHLLENFSRETEPPNAISGQLWYDSANKKIKVHNGEVLNDTKVWKTVGGAEYSDIAPEFATPGDFWFDSSKDQLKVRLDQDWLTVGPQNAGTGLTQMVSRNVLDNNNVPHGIIAATVNGAVTFIISEDEFILNTADVDSTIAGFADPSTRTVKRGITLANTNSTTGISGTGNYRFWGTSSNALRFDGKLPSEYLSSTNVQFANLVKFKNDDGFTVGVGDDLSISVDGNNPVIATTANNQRLTFRVRKNTIPVTPLIIDENGIRPDLTSSAFNIGSLTEQWANVYANKFVGTADKADLLKVGSSYIAASANALNTADTVAVRRRRFPNTLGDSSTSIEATQFIGTANFATSLATPRTINGINFDGTAPIVITDDTKLLLAGGTMTGTLTLNDHPAPLTGNTSTGVDDYQAATKFYVDSQFGQGGILGIAKGGTNASTAAAARTNLSVPRTDGVGATPGSTWNINIAPSVAPITVTSTTASIVGTSGVSAATSSTIVVNNENTTGNSIPAGPGFSDIVSSTSFSLPQFTIGSKTWTIIKVTGYTNGQRIKVTSTATPSVSWQGVITAVDNIGLTITVNVDTLTGVYPGTGLSSWVFTGLGDTWRLGALVSFAEQLLPITGNMTSIGASGNAIVSSSAFASGREITITGTNTGTGSVPPGTYRIRLTNGTTTFTLETLAGAPIVTTSGTLIGLSYSTTVPQPPAITGIVVITNIATQTPANGQTTLTVGHSSQVVTAAVRTITATDQGDGIGGRATVSTKSDNLSDGILGDIPYQTAANITEYLPIGTQGQILASTGQIPEWKDVSTISVGSALTVSIRDRATEAGPYFLTFVQGGLPASGVESRELSVDQSRLIYNSNLNVLTIGTDSIPGTVIADVNGRVLSPNGTVILTNGTNNGADSTFIGNAATATKFAASRTVTLTGDVTGTTTWDTAGNLTIETDFVSAVDSLSTAYVAQLTAGTFVTLTEGGQAYVPSSGDNVTVSVSASSANEVNTIVSRNSSGNFSAGTITATLFNGEATQARYADLAEKYLSDAEYAPGTVVCIGGEKEITASTSGKRALGVISTQPAYMMNSELEGGVYVALKGRVPCKVVGPVTKGDELVAGPDGCATVLISSTQSSKVFGLALESTDNPEVQIIEIVVL